MNGFSNAVVITENVLNISRRQECSTVLLSMPLGQCACRTLAGVVEMIFLRLVCLDIRQRFYYTKLGKET